MGTLSTSNLNFEMLVFEVREQKTRTNNKPSQPTYDAKSTRATLLGGECYYRGLQITCHIMIETVNNSKILGFNCFLFFFFFVYSCLVQSALVGIGHFRVAVNLIIKARLRAKFLLWKLVFIHMQTKLIFIWKAFALSLAFIMRLTATRKWPIHLLASFGQICLSDPGDSSRTVITI